MNLCAIPKWRRNKQHNSINMRNQKMNHPHKSTTHEERYYHIDHDGTVFFRKEEDGWYASVVVRDERDQFVRSTGRNAARRKYFQQPDKRRAVFPEPDYETARDMVEDKWIERIRHASSSRFYQG